jgi:RNA polymerase sigma factor (sigma-70 family)
VGLVNRDGGVDAAQLAEAVTGRDFESFARAAGPALLRLGHALAGHQAGAEDLVQETLIKVGLAWRRVRKGADPVPYARRTLLNLYLNERRKWGREVLVADVSRWESAAPAAAGSLAPVLELLDRLPRRQRAAVAMRYVLDLDDATIAGELGCSESTVRSQIARGLASLRADLGTTTGGDEP